MNNIINLFILASIAVLAKLKISGEKDAFPFKVSFSFCSIFYLFRFLLIVVKQLSRHRIYRNILLAISVIALVRFASMDLLDSFKTPMKDFMLSKSLVVILVAIPLIKSIDNIMIKLNQIKIYFWKFPLLYHLILSSFFP